MLCLLMPPTSMPFVSRFCLLLLGRATHLFTAGWRTTHLCTAGWYGAWVNRKKVCSKDR